MHGTLFFTLKSFFLGSSFTSSMTELNLTHRTPATSPARMPLPVLTALRAATREAHEQLDARFGFLEDRPVTAERYGRHLTLMTSVHEAAEEAMRRASEVGRSVAPEESWLRSTDALRVDLASLGASGVAPEPAPPLEPPVIQPDELPGWIYVFEGSRLGGAVIGRRLHRSSPGLRGALGYFAGCAKDSAQRWRSATAWVEKVGAADVGAAVRGALAAFALWTAQADAMES